MRINLPTPRTFLRLLLCCVVGLHTLNLIVNYLYHVLELRDLIPGFGWWATFFNVDKERNLPTWFSTTLLMLATYVLWDIASDARANGERYARHWRILSLVFAFLSMDEISQMHEMSRKIGVLHLGEASYLSWIAVALPLVLVFCLSYVRFLLRLPPRMRLLIAGGGVLFVFGAVGMEIVGAFVGRGGGGNATPGVAYMEYLVAASIEELFEMLGVVTFFHAISSHLYERQQRATPAVRTQAQPSAVQPRRRPTPAAAGQSGGANRTVEL